VPTDKEHINQTNHNIKFLESFYKTYNFNDWSITVAFYTALHIIEYAIAVKGKVNYLGKELMVSDPGQLCGAIKKANLSLPINHSNTSFSPHVARNLIVDENFSDISSCFSLLYTNSRTARYRKYAWSQMQVEFIVKPALESIIKWCNKEFGTSFKLSLKQ
jgi:hypothetical protein